MLDPTLLAGMFVSLLVMFALGAITGVFFYWRSVKHTLRAYADHKRTHIGKHGWHHSLDNGAGGQYHLESFDGGRIWYAVEYDRLDPSQLPDGSYRAEFKLRILGLAEEIHPGLLAKLFAMENLVTHVRHNGAIRLDRAALVTTEETSLLSAAGFSLVTSDLP